LFHVDEQNGQETAHALAIDTGRTLWSTAYGPATGDEWGSGPRCTPLAHDGRLYVQSLQGEFACLDQQDGKRLWNFSFFRDYGVVYVGGNDQSDAAARRRGNTGSPVILGDRLYVAVGSTNDATIVCFDKRSGSPLWHAGRDEAAYAPLIAGSLAKRDTLVAYTAFSLLGLDAATGATLWRIPLRSHANRHAVTPILTENTVTVSSHTLGTRTFQISQSPPDRFEATERWAAPQLKTSLASTVRLGKHLYGQGPDRNFVCIDADSGKTLWSRSGFGEKPLTAYSSTLAVGNQLLVLTENGELIQIEANPDAYRELGRLQVCGKNWSHPALANGTLYVRDQKRLLAFQLTSPAR